MSDDDDHEEDFAASFRRLVRATEKQIKLVEEERHKVHGFEIEVTNSEMRSMLTEHAKLLRSKIDEYGKRPEQMGYGEYAAAHHAAVAGDGSIPGSPLPSAISEGPFRPPTSILNVMELQAQYCIQWTARLTDDRKIFKLHAHDWGLLFGRPDLTSGVI